MIAFDCLSCGTKDMGNNFGSGSSGHGKVCAIGFFIGTVRLTKPFEPTDLLQALEAIARKDE